MKETYDEQHTRQQQAPQRRRPVTLAQLVKTRYPGEYDDVSDLDLETAVRTRYPGEYDDLPRTNDLSKLPTKPAESVPERITDKTFGQDSSGLWRFGEGVVGAVSDMGTNLATTLTNLARPEGAKQAVLGAAPAAVETWRNIVSTPFAGTPEIERQIASETAYAAAHPKEDHVLDQIHRGGLRVASRIPLLGTPIATVGNALETGDPERLGRAVPAMVELASMSPMMRAGAAATARGAVRGAQAAGRGVRAGTRAAGNLAARNPEAVGVAAGSIIGGMTGGGVGALTGAALGGNAGTRQAIRRFGRAFGDPPPPSPATVARLEAERLAALQRRADAATLVDPRLASELESTLAANLDDIPRTPRPEIDEAAVRARAAQDLADREAQGPRAERRSADVVEEGLTDTPSRPEPNFPREEVPGLTDPRGVSFDSTAREAVEEMRASTRPAPDAPGPVRPRPLETVDDIPGFHEMSPEDQAYWRAALDRNAQPTAARRYTEREPGRAGATPFMVQQAEPPAPVAAPIPVPEPPITRTTGTGTSATVPTVPPPNVTPAGFSMWRRDAPPPTAPITVQQPVTPPAPAPPAPPVVRTPTPPPVTPAPVVPEPVVPPRAADMVPDPVSDVPSDPLAEAQRYIAEQNARKTAPAPGAPVTVQTRPVPDVSPEALSQARTVLEQAVKDGRLKASSSRQLRGTPFKTTVQDGEVWARAKQRGLSDDAALADVLAERSFRASGKFAAAAAGDAPPPLITRFSQ